MDLESIKNSINKSTINISNLEKEIIIKKKQETSKEVKQTLFDRAQDEENKLSNLKEQLQKLKSPYIARNELKYQIPPSKKIDNIYRKIQELELRITPLEKKVQSLYLLPLFINFKST
ncbi:conserved hypothetical protein [Candidatus Roizmanbacteria bacterium]|nr:conserved hypothetical protein [Candidatus Roizmanbacteria bacterium]